MRDPSETRSPRASESVRLSVPILPSPDAAPRQRADPAASTGERGARDGAEPPVSSLRMRLRSDTIADALARRSVSRAHAGNPRPEQDRGGAAATTEPRPGDAWCIRWVSGQLAGYAICCPLCGEIHYWLNARSCRVNVDERGDCEHVRPPMYGSCWTWTGLPESGTLSASRALDAREIDAACSFVGLLRSGWLVW